jgi:hypothetical protein
MWRENMDRTEKLWVANYVNVVSYTQTRISAKTYEMHCKWHCYSNKYLRGHAIDQVNCSQVSHCSSPGSILGRLLWDLWRTKRHWGRFWVPQFPCQFPFHEMLHSPHILPKAARMGHLQPKYLQTQHHSTLRIK